MARRIRVPPSQARAETLVIFFLVGLNISLTTMGMKGMANVEHRSHYASDAYSVSVPLEVLVQCVGLQA